MSYVSAEIQYEAKKKPLLYDMVVVKQRWFSELRIRAGLRAVQRTSVRRGAVLS